MAAGLIYVGCAGWSLPASAQDAFGAGGSHLQRYATRLNACEINSSFHRPHSHATYARWAASVSDGFRFCVKLPKAITHQHKLLGCQSLLDDFLAQAGGLGSRLGGLLVQLPPSLAFDPTVAPSFFELLGRRFCGPVSVEPRHASWFVPQVEEFLSARRIARVLADPVRHEPGVRPGGWPELVYLRLHGSPRTYYSAYEPALIFALAKRMKAAARGGATVWCIFDNTAAGAAAHNALGLLHALDKELV